MIFACAYLPTAVNKSLTACIFRHTFPSWRALDAAWSRAGSGGKTSPRLDPAWLNVSVHTIPFGNDPTKASWHPVALASQLQRRTHRGRWGLLVNSRAFYWEGGPLLTGLLRSNQHRRPDHLGHTFQRGGTQRHKERQKAVTKSLRLWTKMSIIWCLITRWRKGGEERARSVTTTNVGLHALCYGQSRPLWLTNFEEHKRFPLLSAPESYSPLNNGPGSGLAHPFCPPQPGFWAPSLRLPPSLSTVGGGAVAEGAAEKREREVGRQRERERDGGWGLSPCFPRGGAAWILQPRVRGREVVWRSTKEPAGARAGDSDSRE